MLAKQLSLAICALFVFTTFIMVIVAIAGSTSNYKPLNNIYIGTADIAHINVTKVIPKLGPILAILGAALNSPNSSVETFFPVLHKLVDTPAFSPLLTLLSNAENTSATVLSLEGLAPMATSNFSSASTMQQMSNINKFLASSSNETGSIDGLKSLVMASQEDPSSNSSTTVFALLEDSGDKLASTEALMVLNNMTMSEKAQLLPVFELFQLSTNETATFGSLAVLMNATVPNSLAVTLFNALEQSNNLTQTLQQLGSIVPEDSKPALNAVGTLLTASSSPNNTLTTLQDLLQNNVTQSSSAQRAFVSLTSLVNNAENDTLVMDSVESLAMNTNSTSSTQQLVSLKQLFESSSNQTETLEVLANLQAGLATDNSTAEYLPYLFTLLESSNDPKSTFISLVTFTSWAQVNTETFKPVVGILQDAQTNPAPTEEQLNALIPTILDYFNINTKYQLSIFTLCERGLNNTIKTCSKSHAVQDLDFRSIIWDDLYESDFEPYLNALNVTKETLHLDGKLLKRQHEYVPAVKATLALSILSIITAFFLLLGIFYLMFTGRVLTTKVWFSVIFFCLWYTLFTCLSAVIVTAVIGIIKSGTSDDAYGVIFKAGDAYMGLIWTSFVLSLFCPVLLVSAWWKDRQSRKAVVSMEKDGMVTTSNEVINTSESLSLSSNEHHVNNASRDAEKNQAVAMLREQE